ncbi:MAG: S8 family serine peptidase [Xanthomonadaceae bacterium]|nr:S8 family serine peptidase [Xanthomonadaceae bacterium]
MKTIDRLVRYREALLPIAIALGLSACGGGGGGVKPTAIAPPPPPAPTPTTVQPPLDAQLALTNTYAAHNQGYTGAGVTIGVVDTGIMRSHPTLAGRVTQELIYVDPTTNNTAIDDVVGHGTWVSEIAAGIPFGQFPGGIAPGADLVSARIIDDTAPSDNGTAPPAQVTSSAPLGQVSTDLIAAGVKVMNNSWGGITWSSTNTAATQSFHDAYNTFINSWGGLVVFAAGNDSQANPSTIAALPSLAPDLEKGWLTVVAVDSNHPTQLASYSDQCGVAMNYCLAAPGDVIVSGKDDTATSQSYYIVKGTSLAAPQVSGAAALVWQAYPYFTNDQVRQTLLGTADPLGGSQPNPTFGYGELDVGKAVNGPAKFDWGDMHVTLDGSHSVWNNDISGAGGLTLSGAGTLTLNGENTYRGTTQVLAATLEANGLVPAAASVSQGATLILGGNALGSGVKGNLINNGTVVSDNSGIIGNYVQGATGRLSVYLGGVVKVSGTASIAGDLDIVGTEAAYVVNAHTDVLDAAGGLTGTFATLSTAPNVLLTASLNYDANSAWLNVQQVSVTAVPGAAFTPASFGAAQRVQNAFGQINTLLAGTASAAGAAPVSSSFISGAASLQQTASVAALQNSLQSLSGQLHAADAAMMFEAIDAGTRALSDRFDTLLQRPRAGGWAQDLGYHGDMSRAGYSSVGYDLSGWLVGQDYRVGGNGIAGYALSQSQGLGRLSASADLNRNRAVEGIVYGGVIRGPWYAMGRLGFGSYREDMRRQLQLGNQSAAVASDSNGRYSVAYGESGYRFGLGRTQVTPYVDLQYAQLRSNGFNELGADGFGLKSGASKAQRWQAGMGLRATHDWLLPGGGSLSLQTRMLWQQSFGVRGEAFQASFSGINQYAPVGGIGLSRRGGVVGSTLDWRMTPRASLQLGYDRYFGQGQQAQMGTLNFNWRF